MLSSSSSTTFFVGTLRRSTFLFSGSDDVAVTAVSCRFLPGDEELGVIPTRLRVSLVRILLSGPIKQTGQKKSVLTNTNRKPSCTTNLCQDFYSIFFRRPFFLFKKNHGFFQSASSTFHHRLKNQLFLYSRFFPLLVSDLLPSLTLKCSRQVGRGRTLPWQQRATMSRDGGSASPLSQ